jgi:hypothetical protein
MESQYFITGEPNELVAGVSNKVVQWGKWCDWVYYWPEIDSFHFTVKLAF